MRHTQATIEGTCLRHGANKEPVHRQLRANQTANKRQWYYTHTPTHTHTYTHTYTHTHTHTIAAMLSSSNQRYHANLLAIYVYATKFNHKSRRFLLQNWIRFRFLYDRTVLDSSVNLILASNVFLYFDILCYIITKQNILVFPGNKWNILIKITDGLVRPTILYIYNLSIVVGLVY